MWIDLFNSAAKLRRATADEQLWLKDYLTYKDPRAHFRYGGPATSVRSSTSWPGSAVGSNTRACARPPPPAARSGS